MCQLCALIVPVGCACAVATALSPTISVVSTWFCLAWRAQANAAQRTFVCGAAATDSRQPRALAQLRLNRKLEYLALNIYAESPPCFPTHHSSLEGDL
eukprot:4946622-Pleurochrysis_carterae.AAC.3